MAKNILITGASSGIGEATARFLSQQEYTLVLTARNEEKLTCLAQELAGECYIYCKDLTELESIEDLFGFCKEKQIKLDGMVHCAGIASASPVRALQPDMVRNMMTVNYFSFVELVRLFANRKYSNEGSSIVTLSSLASHTCYTGTGNYAASKSAMNSMVTVMAKEYARRKIRVNAVMPANVKTPMTEHVEDFEDLISSQPYGFIEPEQVAYMVEFLLSDKAKFITGGHIPISAGMKF